MDIKIPVGEIELDGILQVPKSSLGIVLFVHGSGSSRLSSRNQFVATVLNEANIATLLFDLLTPSEDAIDERTREFRFNIPLLAERLLVATDLVKADANLSALPIGYFGASTGGGAALIAAAKAPKAIKAVVSRGGRPDLAGDYLPQVKAPTLLMVGGHDEPVITLNKDAFAQLRCIKELTIVPGATHLFEEQNALETVATLAKDWFIHYLAGVRQF
jgi:putative phosphoribosyl transferase